MRMRKTFKVDIDNNTEKEIEFADLKSGDVFRLFEPDGDIVFDNGGNYIWVAKSDSGKRFSSGVDVLQIDCDPYIKA